MSSLQDFANLQLQAPGMLGNPSAPAPAPLPVDAAPPPAMPAQPISMPADIPVVAPREDAPTPAQIGAGANAMEAPAPNLHGPHAIMRAEQKDERQARVDADKSYALQADAAKQNAQLEGDKATAMQRLLNQHTTDAVNNANMQQQNYERLHAVGEKAAADYGAQIQALSDKIANQPQDVFGRAGVNKVSGIIGLILGGLGGSTNGGKNAGVERLNQLTTQKLAQDKYEFEMLGKKADLTQNMYARLRQSGMDDIAATSAIGALQTDTILAQMKATENAYAPSKAKNDLQATLGQLQQQRAAFIQQGQQHKYGQAMQAYSLEQKDRELQNRYDIAQMRFSTARGVEEANPIAKDVVFEDPHFGKNNKSVMGRLQVQDQALKEGFAQWQQYKHTSNWEPLKRAGLRKGLAGSLATTDVGNARVSEARVKAAETETGADPLVHLGPIEIGQKGILSSNMDDRIEQALRTRAEVYYNSLKAAGGHLPEGSELKEIFDTLKVGPQYKLGESPGSIKGREGEARSAALDMLKKSGT